jgi:hypothetical protein
MNRRNWFQSAIGGLLGIIATPLVLATPIRKKFTLKYGHWKHDFSGVTIDHQKLRGKGIFRKYRIDLKQELPL